MKRVLIIYILLVICIGVLLTIIFNKNISEYNKETKFYKEFLGKEVVINKDTLIITDFSIFESTFILSDGSSVNKELIKKLLDERNIKY